MGDERKETSVTEQTENRVRVAENREAFEALLSMIRRLLTERRSDVLRPLLRTFFAQDVADILMALEPTQAVATFRLVDADIASDVLNEIDDTELAGIILDSLNVETVRDILDNMSDDDLAYILRDLDERKAERFLDALLTEDAQAVREIIKQASGTAGSIMTTAFIAVAETFTVAETLAHVRAEAEDSETINYIYVLDQHDVLQGVLSLRELLFAARDALLSDLMTVHPIHTFLDTSEVVAAEQIRHYGLQALPVLDRQNVMQGIITFDDALDVLDEQGGADLYQLAGVPTSIEAEDQLLTLAPPWAAVKRLPWLVICIFGDMVTGGVLKGFEDVLSQVVALAFFVPVLMGSAGNIGTQSLAIAMRGLTGGNLNMSTFLRQLWREGQAGLMLGIVCGGLVAAITTFWQGSLMMGLAVGMAMVCGLTVSTLIGMFVPVLIHRMKGDPALASGPLITTLADIFSIFVYFVLATKLLDLAV